MVDLYRNIKELREQKGLSQDEFAKLTGYTSRSSIAKIEKGEIDLTRSKIIAFAKALGTTPGNLIGWCTTSDANIISNNSSNITNSAVVQGNNATTLIVENGNIHKKEISEQAVELLRIFESLNVKEQTELLSFAFNLEEKASKKS